MVFYTKRDCYEFFVVMQYNVTHEAGLQWFIIVKAARVYSIGIMH